MPTVYGVRDNKYRIRNVRFGSKAAYHYINLNVRFQYIADIRGLTFLLENRCDRYSYFSLIYLPPPSPNEGVIRHYKELNLLCV